MRDSMKGEAISLTSFRTTGWILILAFVFLVVGAMVAPSGAYQGALESRQAAISANRGQWYLSKVFDGLASVLPAIAFVLLAVGRARQGGSLLNYLGGAAFLLAGIVGLIYVVQLTLDPIPFYNRTSVAPISLMFLGLMALGLLLFGASFLGGELPRWSGLLAVAGSALALIVLFLIQGSKPIVAAGPEAGFGIAILLYLIFLGLAIVLVRTPP